MEQVEIFRGPQSTQQGRNALAGAVKIRSKDPVLNDFEVKGRFDLGEYAENRQAFAINVPVLDDMLAVRFSGERFATDGFVTNPVLGIDDYSARELGTLRAKLRFQPTDNLDIVVGHTYSDNQIGTANVDESRVGINPINLEPAQQYEVAKNNASNLRINFDIDDNWSIGSETTYLDTDYLIFVPSGSIGTGTRFIEDRSLAQEVRLTYDDDTLSAVVGAFYTSFSSDLEFSFVVPSTSFGLPPVGTLTFANGVDTETDNFALYGEADYEVIPGLTLTAGLRWDYERQESDLTSSFTLDPAFPLIPNTSSFESTSTEFSALLPKVGISYDWTDDISTGFTVQRGYRSGGSGLNGIGREFEFDAEYTWNYELSLRTQWFDEALTVNANAFFTQWEDQQVGIQFGASPLDFTTVNAGSSQLYGFELETDWDVTDDLNLFGNVGYTKTEFTDFENTNQQGTQIFTGNEFPHSPNWTATIGGSYRFLDNFVIDLSGSYTGASFNSAFNNANELSDSYFIVNGQVGFEADNWSAFLYARNLLDEAYLENRRPDAFSRIGEARVVGIKVNAEF